MYQRIILGAVIIVLGTVLGVYFVYFHRPSTESILEANRARQNSRAAVQQLEAAAPSQQGYKKGVVKGKDDYEYYNDKDNDNNNSKVKKKDVAKGVTTKSQKALDLWEKFIKDNNFVSIGDLYDKCDPDSRTTVGKVILLPDKINGGITSRTYLNATFDKEVNGGQMFIECSYNGRSLYSNHWDLCSVEEGTDDQIIFCPISAGKKKFVKNLKIPNYLPKGDYSTKAWLTNQDDEPLGCAFAEFTI